MKHLSGWESAHRSAEKGPGRAGSCLPCMALLMTLPHRVLSFICCSDLWLSSTYSQAAAFAAGVPTAWQSLPSTPFASQGFSYFQTSFKYHLQYLTYPDSSIKNEWFIPLEPPQLVFTLYTPCLCVSMCIYVSALLPPNGGHVLFISVPSNLSQYHRRCS